MRTRRQNIQLELALEPEAKGEARSAGARGTEARTARAEPERPAAGLQPSMEAVVEPGNLKKALARVRRNKGAPGVDGMTVDELGDHLKAHWPEIRSRLLAGSYTPQPVRRVEIPKPSGGVRLLRVPSAGADVDDPVRRADDRRVVLDDEHRVAVVAQALEHGDVVIDVPRMEPHGRLVQDVNEIDEVAVELPGHLSPAGSRRRTASARRG